MCIDLTLVYAIDTVSCITGQSFVVGWVQIEKKQEHGYTEETSKIMIVVHRLILVSFQTFAKY